MSERLRETLRTHLSDEMQHEPLEDAIQHTVHWFRSSQSDVDVSDVDPESLRRAAWNVAIGIAESWRDDDQQRILGPKRDQ